MTETVERDTRAIKCDCGGYAGEVECTQAEIESPTNCGRSWACCVAAFVCAICGKRHVRRRYAPEME